MGTAALKSNEPTNSLWWLSWCRSYQMIVPHTRISSVPHTRRNSSERVFGTRYHTLKWKWVCGIPHTLGVCGKPNAQTGKTRQCVKKKTSKSEKAWLVENALRKSVRISSIAQVSIFLQNMPEKSPPYHHFTSEIAVSENAVLLFLTRFLVDPLLVLESPMYFTHT